MLSMPNCITQYRRKNKSSLKIESKKLMIRRTQALKNIVTSDAAVVFLVQKTRFQHHFDFFPLQASI